MTVEVSSETGTLRMCSFFVLYTPVKYLYIHHFYLEINVFYGNYHPIYLFQMTSIIKGIYVKNNSMRKEMGQSNERFLKVDYLCFPATGRKVN